MGMAAALQPAIVIFSSCNQPCNEPSVVNWAQHNQSSCAFFVSTGEQNKLPTSLAVSQVDHDC